MKTALTLGTSLLVATALACTTPPKEPPHEAADVAAAPQTAPASPASPAASPAASSASPASPAAKGACAADADCRTWSSYCNEAPCACRVVARGEPDPRCLGPSSIRCLVDPCLHKAARCQSGACVLTAEGRAGATDR